MITFYMLLELGSMPFIAVFIFYMWAFFKDDNGKTLYDSFINDIKKIKEKIKGKIFI